jgi:hypothetical protein
MIRRLLAAACGLAACVLSPPAAAKDSADTCVSVSTDSINEGLKWTLSSSCERKMSCTIDWTLTCKDHEGAIESRTAGRERFALEPAQQHATTAASKACGASNWSIDDVTWDCQPS